MPPMTYDCFTFFNELDLLEIRLNVLDPYVDYFILSESPETFSGKPKPLYYAENKERFAKFNHKIIHIVMPLIKTSNAFERHYGCYEAMEREIKKRAEPEDIVYFSDLDEIWKPQDVDNDIHSLRQLNYCYYLDNRSSENWVGTLVSKAKNIKVGYNKIYRSVKPKVIDNAGWHFTNMGGPAAVVVKLEAYDHQEYNTPEIKSEIENRIKNNEDYIARKADYYGRKFRFWIDEKYLPKYIIDNKKKYAHLFKPTKKN